MKKVNISQIDAFTDKPFCGNPAGVVKSDELTDTEMQHIANEMNLSETAFIISSGKADYKLRWFTPLTEVDLCGHATIASLHYLKEIDELKEKCWITFETRSGILKCTTENNWYHMQIPGYGMKVYSDNSEALLQALGIKESETEGSFLLLDNGYLYIQLKKLSTLGKLQPDFKAIKNISEISPVEGVTVYTLETLEKTSTAHLRFFTPFYGIDEDPVTGSANGPLLDVLIKSGSINYQEGSELFFEQGDFINRPGRVKVYKKDDVTFIAGNALTVLSGNLKI